VSSTRLIAEEVMSCRKRREKETSESASTTLAIPHTVVGSLVGINLITRKQHFGKCVNERLKALTVVAYFLMICMCSAYMISLGNTDNIVGKTTCRHFSVTLLQGEGIGKEVSENDVYGGNQIFCVCMSTK
jgi:hypothetical protein